jgi:hypothetical protein
MSLPYGQVMRLQRSFSDAMTAGLPVPYLSKLLKEGMKQRFKGSYKAERIVEIVTKLDSLMTKTDMEIISLLGGGVIQKWQAVLHSNIYNMIDEEQSKNEEYVLSLFDGMSCGQIALKKAGIKVNQYFASEIKPHAIKVTQHNFPNTIQLGSVLDVKASDLPKIDLLIGGSPCQDFSSANKEKLGLQGEKSGLFYEYLRLLKECEPKYFLLENVAMDDYSYAAISEMLGTYPTNINSELVSGQLRQRSYWTNIGPESFDLFGNRYSMIPQPRNRKIKFQDLLDSGYTDRLKARCLLESESRPLVSKDKLFRRYNELGFINIVF